MRRIVRTFSHVRPNQSIHSPRKLHQNPDQVINGSYEYNRSLIEASLDPLVTIGADGKITDVNAATEKVTGCPRQELIGADFLDFFTEPERARAGYQQVFREGMVQDYALAIRHRQGGVIPVLYNASVFRDRKGEVIGVFAAARDITERLHLEKELKAISGYTRSLIEASLDPLVTISPQGRITDVNKATELVTGKTREELIGTDFLDYFTEPEKAREGYMKVLFEGQVRDYPLTIQHVSGKMTDVLYNATLYQNEKGETQGIFAAARDITKSKLAEEALRLANAYNRSLIEASLDPLVTIGADGKITDVNAATEKVTGCPRQELVDTDFSDYFTEPEKAQAGYQQVFRDGMVQDYALEIRHRDGHVTPVLYNAAVFRDTQGKIAGVFAAARDITESKRAGEQIRKLNAELEQMVEELTSAVTNLERSNQDLEQFAYVASHDLQEPLRMISSYTQLLARRYQGKLDQDADDFIAYTVDGASRMQQLINDLLAFSRVGTPGTHFQPGGARPGPGKPTGSHRRERGPGNL
jgi:PAS domain S-box-containing protein